MAAKLGDYLGGIRTLEDLRARCYVDPDTGCWHWRLSKLDGAARVHLVDHAGRRRVCRGRHAALILAKHEDMPAGHVAFAKRGCTSKDCCNPDHARSGTRVQHGEHLRRTGELKGLPSKIAASRKGWEGRVKITRAMAAEIIASDESNTVLARRLGVSPFAVWSVRVGQRRCDMVPGASVFAWRPQ